ncbi:hypothetical protein ACFE04_027761 [Oxalis oulophora]
MGHYYCGDFMEYLGHDMSMKILMHLDDPSDLVRICLVSKFWRHFVITNDICKKLCLKVFPELCSISNAIEVENLIEPVRDEENRRGQWESLLRNHKVYAFLTRSISPVVRTDCILETIAASSTDNYPEETIENTLEPRHVVDSRPSYWSSEGASNPAASETLIYKLMSSMCLVTEIHVKPFQAYFQYGFPIYSSRAVRFRMGQLKIPSELDDGYPDKSADGHEWADDNVIWTYTSPEFPMAQESSLQTFKLPKPVLCIGGFMIVELLGRVQKQEMDGLYYICISHVQVVGRPLLPQFDVEILDSSGKCALKYYPETPGCTSPASTQKCEPGPSSPWRLFTASLVRRHIRDWLASGAGAGAGPGGGAGASNDESDDEELANLSP